MSQGIPGISKTSQAWEGTSTYLAPEVLPALPDDEPRRQLLPFYEAYFSNFIEGTEFTLDEAAEIVFENRVPDQRPEDAHDVLGTISSPTTHGR